LNELKHTRKLENMLLKVQLRW